MILKNTFFAFSFVEVEFVIADDEAGEKEVAEEDYGNNEMKILQLFVLRVYQPLTVTLLELLDLVIPVTLLAKFEAGSNI